METATFGGGCFWCTEAVFKRVKGVSEVVSGYSGGNEENPGYEKVASGQTEHAEAIQIKFDPQIVTYENLLEIFWATHDPTTLNRQGYDVGKQYRSAIFYHSDEQKKKALESKQKVYKSGTLGANIVTKIEPFKNFYPAESYHQNYYDTYQQAGTFGSRGTNAYCQLVIDPKIKKLLEKFNSLVKEEYK